MAASKDWLPTTREAILSMAKDWQSVAGGYAPAWGIPPANPEELRTSFFTKRKKDVIEFDFGDSGKTVYMAVQVENDGKKGPWGPMVSALIP